jgi:AAA+ superfamily predicted ATPase
MNIPNSNTADYIHAQLVITPEEEIYTNTLAVSKQVSGKLKGTSYVRMGDRVYNTVVNPELAESSVAMSLTQFNDFSAKYSNISCEKAPYLGYAILPYRPIDESGVKINNFKLIIKSYTSAPKCTSTYFEDSEIINSFRKKYEKHYLVKDQVVKFKSPHWSFQGCIEPLLSEDDIKQNNWFALVKDNSRIKLSFNVDQKKIPLLDEAMTFANPIVEFELEFTKKAEKIHENAVFGITYNELTEALQKKINKKNIPCTDYKIELNSGLKITAFVNKFLDPQTGTSFKRISCKKFMFCLAWAEDLQFRYISKTSKLVVLESQAVKASKIALEITEIHAYREDQNTSLKGRLPCFFIDEIKAQLFQKQLFCSSYHQLQLKESQGAEYSIGVKVLQGKESNIHILALNSDYKKPQWFIDDKTELVIEKEENLLANDRQVFLADEIIFTIKPNKENHQSKHCVISEEMVKNSLRDLFKQTLVGDETVILDDQLREYHIVVKKIMWSTKMPLDLNQEHALAGLNVDTRITLHAVNGLVLDKGVINRTPVGLKQTFMLLGIGALTDVMVNKLERFKHRLVTLRTEIAKFDMTPSRGILLYGPTGTGKSKMAGAIIEYLGVAPHNCQFVNTPELQKKYVGETEELIKQLFLPAQKAYDEQGDNSPFFAIFLDEIDAVFGTRQSSNKRYENSAIAQLLIYMDSAKGHSMPPNLLIIATTNNISMIDSALLRPSRFGSQIELPPPSEEGIAEIFRTHVEKVRSYGHIDDNIDWSVLAKLCPGSTTGAIIKDIVDETVLTWLMNTSTDNSKRKIQQSDFEATLQVYFQSFGNDYFSNSYLNMFT